MFGEITETPAVMRSFEGRMDGVLDFHLLDLLRGFFAFQTLKPSEFDRCLKKHFEYFERSLILISFLDNHDMNRFLWIVNGDRLFYISVNSPYLVRRLSIMELKAAFAKFELSEDWKRHVCS
jgi:hypothetical protein